MMTLQDASLGLDRESILPSQRRILLGVIGLGMLFLLLPRLGGSTLLQVHKEDGVVFLADFVDRGWSSVFDPYTGYQHWVPRSIAGVCASGPAGWFAGCAGFGASLVRVVLAVIALAALTPYARSTAWAVAAATVFVWAPVGQQEALGNLTNLRWFLDAGAVVLLVGVWRRPVLIGLVSLVAIGAAMTDPLAVVIAPLALWRLVVLPGRARIVPGLFLVATLIHFLVLERSARSSENIYLTDPGGAAAQLGVRGLSVPFFGQNGTEVLLHLGVAVAMVAGLAGLAVCAFRVRWSPPVALAFVLAAWGVGLLALTLTFTDMVMLGFEPEWRLGDGSRYSVPPGILLTMGTVLVLPWTLERATRVWRLAVVSVLALMPLAVLADATGDSANTADPTWSAEVSRAREECASGAETARVQMTPADVPLDWSTDLPCAWLRR